MATGEPELTELRTFCVAAELGSLGRAAIRLRVSQPSLSKRLQSLEAAVGVRLLDRSPKGVKLTPAGRELYGHARGLLESADAVAEVMGGLRRTSGPVRLAASHSATEAFVAGALGARDGEGPAVDLVIANSLVVRDMVADGRADLGFAAARPHHTPNPAIRTEHLADDAVVCAVPAQHPWARRASISLEQLAGTPMVLRDPASNSRWTVDSALRERGLALATPAAEAPTPAAAMRVALSRNAPLLLSRHVLAGSDDFAIVAIEGIAFPRQYELVLPSYGAPADEVSALIALVRDHIRIWLR
jgi:DNA-binding transcriptional LysR family regulator